MFKCEYPRLESLLKDTRFPSTHESPVEERVIQQFAQSLESETASSEIILQQRRSRQWKISTAKQWSLLISAIEDDTSLFPNTFSSTVPRSPPCTSFTSISSASRHHLPRWKEASLFRDASCWVDEMGSVIGKNTFDKLAREIAAELGRSQGLYNPFFSSFRGNHSGGAWLIKRGAAADGRLEESASGNQIRRRSRDE